MNTLRANIFFAFSVITSFASTYAHTEQLGLEHFAHRGASILVSYLYKGETWYLLSREAGGHAKGTYADFGGATDPDETPLMTAAREGYEELNAGKTLGISLEHLQTYIDAVSGNTTCIIAQRNAGTGCCNYVTYLTHFPLEQIEKLINNFNKERAKATEWKYREKDSLALVKESDLKEVVANSKPHEYLLITAKVVNPQTTQLETKTITLRAFFADALRSFFKEAEYTPGEHPAIRFYV